MIRALAVIIEVEGCARMSLSELMVELQSAFRLHCTSLLDRIIRSKQCWTLSLGGKRGQALTAILTR